MGAGQLMVTPKKKTPPHPVSTWLENGAFKKYFFVFRKKCLPKKKMQRSKGRDPLEPGNQSNHTASYGLRTEPKPVQCTKKRTRREKIKKGHVLGGGLILTKQAKQREGEVKNARCLQDRTCEGWKARMKHLGPDVQGDADSQVGEGPTRITFPTPWGWKSQGDDDRQQKNVGAFDAQLNGRQVIGTILKTQKKKKKRTKEKAEGLGRFGKLRKKNENWQENCIPAAPENQRQ